MTVEQLNQKQTNDLRRLVTAARIDYREAWAVAQTAEAAARIEEAEKLLTAALAILGEEPGDEVQAWEADQDQTIPRSYAYGTLSDGGSELDFDALGVRSRELYGGKVYISEWCGSASEALAQTAAAIREAQ